MPFYGCTPSASSTRARYRTLIVSAFCMACSFAFNFVVARAAAAPLPDVTVQVKSARTSIRARAAQDVIDHQATASGDALNAAAAIETNPEIRVRLLTASYEVDSSSAVPFLIAALRGDK